MKPKPPRPTGPPPILDWEPTEFGRRTPDGKYRVIHQQAGWRLCNAEWDPLTEAAVATIEEAQSQAETIERTELRKRKP